VDFGFAHADGDGQEFYIAVNGFIVQTHLAFGIADQQGAEIVVGGFELEQDFFILVICFDKVSLGIVFCGQVIVGAGIEHKACVPGMHLAPIWVEVSVEGPVLVEDDAEGFQLSGVEVEEFGFGRVCPTADGQKGDGCQEEFCFHDVCV